VPIQVAWWPHQKEAFPQFSVAQCIAQDQPIAAAKRIGSEEKEKALLCGSVTILCQALSLLKNYTYFLLRLHRSIMNIKERTIMHKLTE
jgi:hypothetical protein